MASFGAKTAFVVNSSWLSTHEYCVESNDEKPCLATQSFGLPAYEYTVCCLDSGAVQFFTVSVSECCEFV